MEMMKLEDYTTADGLFEDLTRRFPRNDGANVEGILKISRENLALHLREVWKNLDKILVLIEKHIDEEDRWQIAGHDGLRGRKAVYNAIQVESRRSMLQQLKAHVRSKR